MKPAFAAALPTPKRPRVRVVACAAEGPGLSRKVESELLAAEQAPAARTAGEVLPVQIDLWVYQARVMGRRKKSQEAAERLYGRCVEANRTDGRAWLGLARIRISEGDYSAARRLFKEGLRVRKNAYLLQAWGVMEERLGGIERARGLYTTATRVDDTHCASWVALGLWYKRYPGEFDKARECFRKGAAADPTNYYVWHVWGVLEKECRKWSAARECFERGVEANPMNAPTFVVWGSLEDALGNYSVAVELFEKAHKANPRNAHAYVSHAVAVERAGDVNAARELLRKAMAARPKDAAPYQSLALLEWRAGNLQAARALFEEGVSVDPRHAPLWHAWARVEHAAGDFARARELFQEAVWAAPKSAHVMRTWHAWAMLEFEAGHIAVARRYFAHGLEVDSRSVAILTGLAKLEAADGNMPRARDLLEDAVRLQPTTSFNWRLYEDLEREFGSLARAAAVFERSVVAQRQVDDRVVVSEPLPGDFAAGGMWIGAEDLRPRENPFAISIGADFRPSPGTTLDTPSSWASPSTNSKRVQSSPLDPVTRPQTERSQTPPTPSRTTPASPRPIISTPARQDAQQKSTLDGVDVEDRETQSKPGRPLGKGKRRVGIARKQKGKTAKNAAATPSASTKKNAGSTSGL